MARRPYTFKQRDVTRALRGAKAAGIQIRQIEIDTAGKIIVVAASDSQQTQMHDNEMDRELEEFKARRGQS